MHDLTGLASPVAGRTPLKNASFFLLLLLLIALAHSEIPELIQLSDNPSNDFGLTSCDRQTLHPTVVSGEQAPLVGSRFDQLIAFPASNDVGWPFTVPPSKLTGQDILLLCSISRT